MTPADKRTGIVAVDFSLQHPAAKAMQRIGSAELRLEGTNAQLAFEAPVSGR